MTVPSSTSADQPPRMRYTLRYKHQDIELPEGNFIMGRAATCELSLDDPLVSRSHARLVVTADGVVLEDLGSRNGVRVNGERIAAPRHLEHGDHFSVGSQEMQLSIERDMPTHPLVKLPEPPKPPGSSLGLLGILAEKAIGLGRAEEAERLVKSQLEQLLRDVQAGHAVPPEHLERAADLAVRLATATSNAEWADYVFTLYAGVARLCSADHIDQLYTVLRRVQKPTTHAVRAYLTVLRGLDLAPAERFLVSRIEGLERLITAR